MTSTTNKFSFYDAAEVAQEEAKIIVNTEYTYSTESEVDDVRDEADAIGGERDEERVQAAACTEAGAAATNSESGGVNQWLDRANALSEIRMLLKEEIEQDSGEYCACYMHASFRPLFFVY